MDVCDLCRYTLNCNGKRILCPDCQRVLCVSCNEMKTKLLLMTNGVVCPCSLLQEIVVPDIDKKHDVQCNTKKPSISRKNSDNSSSDGFRRGSLPRTESPASENICLDHEHDDSKHCDSTNQSGKLNVLEKKNVNAEENIDDGGKSSVSGCTSDMIHGVHTVRNEINNDNEILDKEGVENSQCSFDEGFQRKQDETTTVETEHLYNFCGNEEKDISHHQSSREKDTEQEIDKRTNKETTTFEDTRSSANVVSNDIPNVQEKSKNGLQDYNSSRKPPEWKEMSPQSNELGANWNYNSMSDQPWGMFSGDGYNRNMEFIQNDFESLKMKENISPLSSKPTTLNLHTVEQNQSFSKPMKIPTVSELPVLGMKKEDESLQDSGQHRVGNKVLKTESQREDVRVSDCQSPNESTSDLENKIIKMEETASPSARTKKKLSKHTCAGCGRRDCEGQFMKLMKAMTSAAKSKNYTIHNVVPDGNCMFAAIVDQLELNNDYSFSSKSLRQACVEHLRSNPESEDGTHFEMFMDGESWSDYLNRMSQEGQWGDHLMLQAISQVTKRNIEVLHGGENEEITKINTPQAKEGQASLHLGHVGEFHYVSLREIQDGDQEELSSDEEEEVFLSNFSQSLSAIQDPRKKEVFVEDYIDPYSDIPSLHMSFLLKTLLPISIVLNDADKLMHKVISKEYQEQQSTGSEYHQYQKTSAKSTNTAAEPSPIKLIGDIVNGLFVDYMFLKEKLKGKDGYKNWSDVPTLLLYNTMTIYTNIEDANKARRKFGIIRSDDVHPGYLYLLTYDSIQSGTAEEQKNLVCIPKSSVFPPMQHDMVSEEKKEAKACHYPTSFSEYIYKSAVSCPWPEEACEWITRERPSKWPPEAIINSIVADGCHVVSEAHPTSVNPDIEFSFCFGVAERTLCNEALSRDQRYCLLVFLAICSHGLRDIFITTDCLKAVFFYACEELPLDCWSSSIGSCLFYLFISLVTHIENKCIPCYFISSNNTIDHWSSDQIKDALDKLNTLRWSLLQHVLGMVKDHEMGWEFQQVIMEDKEQFKITRNTRESVLNCFVPYAIKIARSNLLHKRFNEALDTLQSAFEDRLTVATCDDQVPFQSFFNEAVQGISLDSQWWFLLYADEKLGMHMSSELSMNMQPVTLGEVVGDAYAKDYASHLVPAAMVSNRCQLLTNLAWFLLTKYRTKQAVDCLILCITVYREKLDYESHPDCSVEILEKYFDFNERTMFKVLIYLYNGLSRQKMQDNFTYYFDVVRVVCEKLDCREAYNRARILSSVLNEEMYQYWSQKYQTCERSDPSLEDELFLETIQPSEY